MNSTAIALLTAIGESLTKLGETLQEIAAETTIDGEPEQPAEKAPPARRKGKTPPPEEDDENEGGAEDDEDETPPPAAKGGKKGKKAKAVTLPELQDLASALLEAGQRSTLKQILSDHGAKTLSSAPESAYADLHAELTEAVAELEED